MTNFDATTDVTESAMTSVGARPAFAVSDATNFDTYAESIPHEDDTADEYIQPPFPQKRARELKRLPPDMFDSPPTQKNSATNRNSLRFTRLLRGILLAAALCLAAVVGFFAAGVVRENSSDVINDRENQRRVIVEQQRAVEAEAESLLAEKKRLELEKELLEAKKQSLEKEASRLKGKHEQLFAEEEANSDSFIGSLLDKVTGRNVQRREEMERTAKEKDAATKDGDEADRALQEAQDTLDDINRKLAEARALKKDIDSVREEIESAYAENKDTFDAIVYYTKAGVRFFFDSFDEKSDETHKGANP